MAIKPEELRDESRQSYINRQAEDFEVTIDELLLSKFNEGQPFRVLLYTFSSNDVLEEVQRRYLRAGWGSVSFERCKNKMAVEFVLEE